jgi:dolichol-phosphate mannosyltransferase
MESEKRITNGENVINPRVSEDRDEIIINSYMENFVPRFAILLPVHNEENSITEVVTDVYDKLVIDSKYPFEIILSEDGSKDKTREVIANLSKKIPLKASLSNNRKGYAGGIKKGLKLVSAPYVVISDSDGQLKPEDFWLLKDRLEELGYPNDVIISGNRKVRADSLHRKVISKTFQRLNSMVFDLPVMKDITSPFKLMSTSLAKELANDCKFMSESFWTEYTVRACHKNIRIVEVEVQHSNRLNDETVVYKKSKIPKIILRQIAGLIKLKSDLTGKGFFRSILETKSIKRLLTFALIGSSGAGVILFLTWLGVNFFHLHYLLSAAIGIETSIVWAFILNDRITFKDKIDNYNLSYSFFRFMRYNCSALGGEGINLSALFLLTSAGWFYLYSEAVAILIAFVFNYTLARTWVWKKKTTFLGSNLP